MSITWTGTKQLKARLQTAAQMAPRQLAAALYQEGEEIMTTSKGLVPVDLGILRASGHVQAPVVQGNNVTVTLGYGGAASDYAIVQHERLDYHHETGQAKFLEQPVNEAAQGLGERVKRRARKIL